MEVMKGSGQGLMQQLASTVAAAQVSRSSQTVGTRFRDQLKDLITRLDQSAHLTLPVLLSPLWHATTCMCTTLWLLELQLHLQQIEIFGRPHAVLHHTMCAVPQQCMLQAQEQLLSSKLA